MVAQQTCRGASRERDFILCRSCAWACFRLCRQRLRWNGVDRVARKSGQQRDSLPSRKRPRQLQRRYDPEVEPALDCGFGPCLRRARAGIRCGIRCASDGWPRDANTLYIETKSGRRSEPVGADEGSEGRGRFRRSDDESPPSL